MHPLTVLIPCKDERHNILECIDSVREIADEILVADSGSTDGTLELARSTERVRVIEREYINSANFKNWAIPQA
ncbi:MAG: glycosyltransferase, partial [Aeoliella sp.]